MSEVITMDVKLRTIVDEASLKDTKNVLENARDQLVENPVGGMKEQIEQLKAAKIDSIIPNFGQEFATQVSVVSANVDRLISLYDKIGKAQTKLDRQSAVDNYINASRRAQISIAELQNALNASKKLNESTPAELMKELTGYYQKNNTDIRSAFRQASSPSKTGFTIKNGQQLISLLNSGFFQKSTKGYSENFANYIKQNGETLAAMLMPIMATGFNREDFYDAFGGSKRKSFGSVREMLPEKFRKIKLTQNPQYKNFNTSSTPLTDEEYDNLERFVSSEQGLLEEFEKAGIAKRVNGRIKLGNNLTRNHIHNFGGRLVALFESGARGIAATPEDDITDVNNPKYLERIVRKNNIAIGNATRGMRIASEYFPWIQPEYLDKPTDFSWKKDLGPVTAKPRHKTGSFYLLPFEGDRIQNLPVANSLMQQRLSAIKGADPFIHNARNTNEIYVRMPVEELQDYETSEERKAELKAQIAKHIGEIKEFNGARYRFTGFTGANAAFTREDLFNAVTDNGKDLSFFTNGERRREFTSGAAFGKAVDYMAKQRTEGENIRDLYGTDLSKLRVVVADWKAITGADGQNLISNELVPSSFQGRDISGKSTYFTFSEQGLRKQYANRIVQQAVQDYVEDGIKKGDMFVTARENEGTKEARTKRILVPAESGAQVGDLFFDKGGINNGYLVMPRGTNVVEDYSNIKVREQYAGLSQEELNEARTAELRESGIFAKTTAESASTPARYISSQAASSLSLSPKAREYFRNVYLERMRMLDDFDSVKSLLFSGDDALSQAVNAPGGEALFYDKEVQDVISQYRQSITQSVANGNLLLPQNVGKYAMLGAWLPDIFNALIPEDQLTEAQKALSLGDKAGTEVKYDPNDPMSFIAHRVAYFKSAADNLFTMRNPDTASGNQGVKNLGADEFFQQLATDLGMDKEALYVNPASKILTKWQTADFDGDTVMAAPLMKSLKGMGSFGDVMMEVLAQTAEDYAKMIAVSGRTEEEQKTFAESREKSLEENGRVYRLDNPEDMAEWFVRRQQPGAKMGLAHAVTIGARQLPMTGLVARAIRNAEDHYDADSNGAYKGWKEWLTTQDEWDVVGEGSPFYRLSEWRRKSITDSQGEEGQERFDQNAFNKKRLDAVNFSSIHDAHGLGADFDIFFGANMHPGSQNLSVPGADWETIFEKMPEVSAIKEVAQLQNRLRELRLGKLQGDFLAFDDSVVSELGMLSNNALSAITEHVNGMTGLNDKEKALEIERLFKSAGGYVPKHLKEWGLTRSNINSNPELRAEVDKAIALYGEDKVYARSSVDTPIDMLFYSPAEMAKKRKEEKEKERQALLQQKEQEKLQKQANQQVDEQTKQTSVVVEKVSSVPKLTNKHPEHKSNIAYLPKPSTSFGPNSVKEKSEEESNEVAETTESIDKRIAQCEKDIQDYATLEAKLKDLSTKQGEYNRIVEQAGGLLTELTVSAKGKENKIKGRTLAQGYFNQLYYGKTKPMLDQIKQFTEENPELIKENPEFGKTLASLDSQLKNQTYRDFADKAALYAKEYADEIEKDYNKKLSPPSAQKQKIDSYLEKEQEAQGFVDFINKDLLNNPNIILSQQMQENLAKQRKAAEKYIASGKKNRELLEKQFTEENEKAGTQALESLQMKFGLRDKNSLGVRVEARKQDIQKVRDLITKQHEEGYYGDNEYDSIMGQLDGLEQRATKVSIATQDMMSKVSRTVENIAHRLTHQLFQKALQETKRFIKEFDSSMNEIQAITLKSDKDMVNIRQNTVNKAIGLRTSVSNVATTEAALYRQGLSDAEVSSRTDSIIKFATVTKLNVAEATKIITTALQNDLVPSAEQAMDALVALGDSAATTAAEIGKGMQKAAASAKVAGVSYSELTALLTIGTSDTQLSGTQVGTALQTVFSRMRRLSISGYTADQNGEKTTASDAEAALKSVGVDLWDDKTIGKMRSAYDVLSDLSKVWQNLSDAQKNIVMNALAGTRQTNVFSTLMEGMAEDGGATLDKYLGLAEGSEGITQTKYEIAMQSLAASMDTLKSSWDSVVESMVNGGSITGILDSVSGFFQMFANAGDIGQGMSLVAGGIVGIGVALASIANANPVIKALSTVFGLAAGLITAGGISAFANLFNSESEDERKARESQEAWSSIQKSYSYTKSDESSINKAITEVEKAGKAWKELDNETNTDNLVVALGNLGNAFPAVSDSVKEAIADLNNWTKAVDDAKEKADQFTKGNIENQIDKIVGYIDEYTPQNYNTAMKRFASLADLRNAGTYLASGVGKEASFWGYGGGLIERYNKGWLDYNLDVDKLMQSGNENDKAKALVYGYRNSEEFRRVVNSVITNEELLSDLGGKTNADDLLKAGDFASRASNALDVIMQKSGAVDALSLEVLADTLGITKQELTEFNDSTGLSFQKKFYKLAANNSGVRSWIQENNPALYSQFFDENGNPTSFFENVVRNPSDNEAKAINQMYAALINEAKQGDVEYNTKRKQAALAFFNEDLSSRMPFEEMATEEYDSEFLKNLFIKSLGESNIVDEYGDYDKEALKAFVVDFLNGWKDGTGNALNEFVEKNADYSDFKYYIDKTDRNTWFNNYEDAIQYARRNKIDYNEIKGQNGESAYQSAAKTTDALLATKDADKTARNLNTALDVIRNVSSLQELQSEYDKLGLGQELTNVLGSNDELLGLFEMMRNDIVSYSEFQDYASDLAAGRTDRASLVSSIYENLISGDLSVKDFRSLPAYSGLYKTFSSIVGDSADAVLNAIEDGVQSADLTNAFNKSIIEQRIKEAMPASNYLSEAIAYATTMTTGTALQQQEYNANKTKSDTEFANYAAAINRYISGNAKPEDYATIAAMGDFSETALRNGVNKSAVRASYKTRVQARTDQLNAELQGALASLGIEGLTLDEYLAQVANREEDVYRFSELELKDEFEQAKHNLPEGIETFEQYANFRNRKIGTRSVSHIVPRNNAVDQLLANYQVDENGNLVYTPASEEYLSPAAVLTDEARLQTNKNRKGYAAIYQSLRMNRGIKSAIDDQSYAELLQQDEQLRRMLQAGANNEAIRDYVGRQLSGASGSFQDNYGWIMTSLLGGTDTSKWNAKAIRTQWANAQNNPALLQFYNEMLSSMAGGDIIKQIAQGGEGNLDEAIELYLKDYYTQLSNRYGSEFAQAIGLNQATLATGNASERFRLLSGFNQNIAQGKNAQYYLNNWSSQSAGILSSYLGITEEEVKQADRTELQDAVNQRVKEEIIRQAESYGAKLEGIDIDSSSLSDVRSALEASLSSLSGDTKTFVENLIKQIDETGNIVGEASKSLSQIVTDTQQQMQESTYEYQAFDFIRNNAATALTQAQTNGTSIFEELSKTAGWNQEWNSVVGGNQGLIAASSLYQNGTITGQQYQDFLGMQMSGAGKNADYYSMLAGAALGQGFQNGQFTSVEALQTGIANAKGDENLLNFYTELSSKYGEFLSQIESGDSAEDALERLNEQWSQDKTNDLTKWLKNGSQAAQTLTALNKGGKDSAQAIASLRKEASQLNNAAVAIRSSAGKSGKQLSQNERSDLASVTGEDENLIKEMTKEQVEQLRQRAQESIDQSFVEDFGNTIAAQLNSLMAENPVDFEMAVQAHIGSDGQLDLSEISAIAADLKNQALAELASHAGTIGQLFVELKKEGLSETAIAKVIAGSVTGTGKRTGGGGGGGGGKSAADKLLEEQKRKVAEIEHQSKMLEIQEKQYDYTNDYSEWNNNIADQIGVQEKLRAQYVANIKEMTDMLAKVKEGSDDWKKLKDAIMQAEEALASINNTINELNGKQISILQQQQENADKPDSHALTMLQKRAERYQTTGQFEGYAATMQQSIDVTKKQIDQNNNQIKEWEDLLLQYEEGSDSWIETRDNIWKLKEENASLENQVTSDMIDLQDAKINQIAQDLQNQQASFEHSNAILETYGGMYQSMNNQAGYRGTLQETITNNTQLKELNDAAIEELREQIEAMEESDPSRQNAIQTLYQLEEASAQYEASILSNRQAIEESLVNELTQGYSDTGSTLDHELKLLQEAEKEFLRDDDFVNYENILSEESRNAEQRLQNQRDALASYLELQSSGQITEGSQQWRDLEETIRQTKESIATLSNEYEELIDKIQTARFENLQKNFTEADELAQHNLKMIQYEETRYQNRGELTNYGTLLAQDTDMQRERAADISNYVENLKEQLEVVKDNPELYKKITQEIYKYEEQLSSVNNTIEKNEKLLIKNEETIRKVRMAVENSLDKAIRERIQRQREMLQATVSIENSILDVIRKNKQEEWNLEKKTLDIKKQALNEEKNLINERLNARKEALNEEEKYEELAELQRQLALISADTTRTKDAAELRKQIADIQKDISWDLASDQANASIQAIDDEIKAIDSYTSTYEEDLNEMLSDANNFTDDLNATMGGSFDEFLEWMKANNEAYKLATDEAKQVMEQGWEDTWKKMKDELDSYWSEVDESMRSREGFIEYMRGTDAYRLASDTGRASLEHQWGEMYDNYTASLIDNAEFDHDHQLIDKVDELKDWTFNVKIEGIEDYLLGMDYSNYAYNRRTDYEEYDPYDNYAGIGKKKEPEPKYEVPNTPPASNKTSGTGQTNGKKLYSQVEVLTGKENPSQKDIDELKKKYPWLEGLSLDPRKKYTEQELEKLYSTHERLTGKNLEGIGSLLDKYNTVSIPEPPFASSSALNQLVSTYSNNNNSGSFNLNFYGGIQVREEADIDKVATELEHKVAKTLIKQGQNNYFSLAR